MLRKPSLLCSCGGFQLLHQHPNPSSVLPHPSLCLRRKLDSHQRQCKRFAHVHNSHPLGSHDDLTWPSTPNFSPYDLFKQERNAPYSKGRFYELAKLYHPDRPCNGHPICKDLSHSVRLERYRIIVAAHELLSDPSKREAYDKFGHGWHPQGIPLPYAGKEEPHGGVDPIFKNATWEDWEEWRQARNGQSKTATAVPPNTFATFLVLVALFVGSAHAVVIGKYSSIVEEQVQDLNEKCSAFLNERRGQTLSQIDSGDARIQHFLIKRDPSGNGLREGEEEAYQRILGAHRTTTVADDINELEKTPQRAHDKRTVP